MPDRDKTIRVLETMLMTVHTSLSETERDAIRTAVALLKEHGNCENCAIAIEDRQPVIRCKDCKHRGDRHKCIVAFVAEKQEMPYFFYDNRGEWFCADGEKRDD